MSALDIESIRQQIAHRDARRQACVDWCLEALKEFPEAARTLATPTRGNPDFLKNVFGRDARSGIFPILRDDHPDNILIELGHGAAFLGSGQLYTGGSATSLPDGAVWIAARCDFSIDVAKTIFTHALMGESWTIREALRAAARVSE